ncbi:MAG: hypothetical protein V3T77_05310, partial [Planctomycetota bacterium]
MIPATAQQTPSEQKCTNALNKNGSKVSKDMSKQAESCLKNFGKGKPLSPDVSVDTLEECVLDDPKDKIQKRKDRTESAFDQFCDPLPGFGATDPNTVNDAAMAKELNILRDIFGSDLDLVAIAESDPSFTDPGDARDASKCQRKVLKAVFKCQQAKMKEFLKCKKAGLKDLSIFDASGLEACYEGADPINISKKCTSPNGGIFKAVFKKCDKVDQRAFLSELFPGCVTDDSFGLAACLDRIVECRFCQYANAADGLNRDCDLFDDGQANGSCLAAGEVPPPNCDSFLPAGEDRLRTQARFAVEVHVPPLPVTTVILNGPTVIQRGNPLDPGDLRRTIPTEMVSMSLTGTFAGLPITLTESPTLSSLGEIKAKGTGSDFPADS